MKRSTRHPPHAGLALRLGLAVATVCALLALGGCVVAVPVAKTDLEEKAPEQAASIVVGQSDRLSARTQLGAPWLSSEVWSLDLFRTQGRNVSAPFMFIFWWPVPLGVAVDKVSSYVLVDYDAQGMVTAEAHGLASDPSIYAEMGTTGAGSASGVQLDTGGSRFGISGNGKEQYLSIDSGRGKAYLASHPWPDSCRLVIGFADSGYSARLVIDGDPRITFPDELSSFLEALVVLRLEPGPHRLELLPASVLQKFAARADINCAAGETLYVVADLRFDHAEKGFFAVLNAQMQSGTAWPAAFDEHRWLVWGNERWLLPAAQTDK